jgi:hypothetical protein
MEKESGAPLDDDTFEEILSYTTHKAKAAGQEESYVPILLADEIRNYLLNSYMLAAYIELQRTEGPVYVQHVPTYPLHAGMSA